MEYTDAYLKECLKEKYNPKAEYLIETHRGAINRLIAGTHTIAGEVPDATENDSGTMIVMEKVINPTPTKDL